MSEREYTCACACVHVYALTRRRAYGGAAGGALHAPPPYELAAGGVHICAPMPPCLRWGGGRRTARAAAIHVDACVHILIIINFIIIINF